MVNTNDYMPVGVAAERLGIRRSALYEAIKRGHFTPVEVYGAGWLSVEEVEAYRRHTQPGGQKAKGRPKSKHGTDSAQAAAKKDSANE